MAQGQMAEYERLDNSLDATSWQLMAARYNKRALYCLQQANAKLEHEALQARREAKETRVR